MIYYTYHIHSYRYLYARNQLNSISEATVLVRVLFININKNMSRLGYLFFIALN